MRRNDWASRMFAVIEQHLRRPFEYAQNDCSLFVARVVDAMTDSTFEAQILAEYKDEESALALIARHGSLSAAVSHYLGPPSNERALRGDVVMFDGGQGDAVGIWDGRQIVAMGESGLRSLRRTEVRQVWRVS